MSAGGAEGRVHRGVGHGVLARGHRVVLLQLHLCSMKASISHEHQGLCSLTWHGSGESVQGAGHMVGVASAACPLSLTMLLLVTGDQAPVLWQLQTSAR